MNPHIQKENESRLSTPTIVLILLIISFIAFNFFGQVISDEGFCCFLLVVLVISFYIVVKVIASWFFRDGNN